MSAIEMLRARPAHAYVVLPSGVCVQLRRPSQADLREAGLTLLPGLVEAAEVAQEADDEADVATGKPAELVAQHRATTTARRLKKALKHFERHPELADQLQQAADAWVCASVVAIGIAADLVDPGVYGTAPDMREDAGLEAGGFTIRPDQATDRVLDVSALAATERSAIAAAAQRHASAKERLPALGSSARAAARVPHAGP